MAKLEGYKYITYLIGSMEKPAEGDDGSSKRGKLQEELLIRKIYPINPVQLEKYKINVNTETAKKQMNEWLKGKHFSEFKDFSRLIWKGKYLIDKKYGLIHIPGDIDYVTMSDWITCVYNKGDKPCVEENTLVHMEDFSTKPIKNIQVGDKVLGWKVKNGRKRLTVTTVLAKYKKGKKKCLQIEDEKGNKIICTPDHKFLTRLSKKTDYKESSKITNAYSIKFGVINKDFLKGWLIGYLNNDGCYRRNKKTNEITCLSDKQGEMEKVKEVLEGFGFHPTIRRKGKYYTTAINRKKEYNKLDKWRKLEIIKYSTDMKRGYLSGSIDADGWYDRWSIRYSQSPIHRNNLIRFKQICKQLDINYSLYEKKPKAIYIEKRKLKSKGEIMFAISKTFAFYIPSLLNYKRKNFDLTLNSLKTKRKKTNTNKHEVYDITTSTGNFMANGFIVHNCGTYGEAFMSFEHDIPIYLITDVTEEEEEKEIPKSFLQSVYGSEGYIFRDMGAYLNFIENKYKIYTEK